VHRAICATSPPPARGSSSRSTWTRRRPRAWVCAISTANFGTGSLIQNVWIEHAKVAYWIKPGTDGLYLVNGRVRNVYADGINLHAGIKNTLVSHVHARNTGDDAFAMWSDGAINEN
jgi:hypothetical protein